MTYSIGAKINMELEYDTMLWGWLPDKSINYLPVFFRHFRNINIIGPVVSPDLPWKTLFKETIYALGFNGVCYNESLIYLDSSSSVMPTIENEESYKNHLREITFKKHPKWSKSKIERAISNFLDSNNKHSTLSDFECKKRIARLKMLCLCGKIILVFDDGGSSSPEIGGTRGLPFSERKPKMEKAYEIDLESEDMNFEKALHVPFWTPVTYRANELSKIFSSLKNSQKETFIKDVVTGKR